MTTTAQPKPAKSADRRDLERKMKATRKALASAEAKRDALLDERRDLIRKGAEAGMSRVDIGNLLGVSRSAIGHAVGWK